MEEKDRDPSVLTRSQKKKLEYSKYLEEFCNSPKEVYSLGPHLTKKDRKAVEAVCERLGLFARSFGTKARRGVSIFKHEISEGRSEKKKKVEADKDKPMLSFSPEAKSILRELFMFHPPCDEDTGETSFDKYRGALNGKRSWKDKFFSKPKMNKLQIAEKIKSLANKMQKDSHLQKVAKKRLTLPIANFRDVITSTMESNQIVLISGETGCGKTTQVPQYLLDHIWSKGQNCKIICAQPRRLSAISVSERISYERGESIGTDIGYKVRLQTKGGGNSSVVFCTNGILLRLLVGQGSGSCLSNITHIIVDEIHERDCFSDFMLAIMRDMLPSNRHLRLILMSATLDADRFSEYFGGCAIIRVPGFTYPVRTLYLEDVLSILESKEDHHLDAAKLSISDDNHKLTEEDKLALDKAISLAWTKNEFDNLIHLISYERTYNYQHSSTWLTPLMVFAGKGRVSDVCMLLSAGADWGLRSKEGLTALELAERENQVEAHQIIKEYVRNFQPHQKQLLNQYLETANPEQVDVNLIGCLLKKICDNSKDGAILVFLPGWDDINKTREKLLQDPYFKAKNRFLMICLHSMIPSAEQKKVFERSPPGCRKIVLATNIAESAITIDDVVYVIDSGRMKEKNYDPHNNVSTLETSWVSKANAKQREGRAGRCQAGICYHLYSRLRASTFPEYRDPEIRRIPIEEVCLQIKMLDPNCKIPHFLQKLMDPPLSESIGNALTALRDIGALTPEEDLTEFGETIGHLPIHPVICKMLFFASLVNCLNPALTLACASDCREPFTMPTNPRDKQAAADAKLKFASVYGGDSDHLAVLAAYEQWKAKNNPAAKKSFCNKHFVSDNAMKMLDGMRNQLQSELMRHKLIPEDVSSCSMNSSDPGILRAVLAVGLYPMVGKLKLIKSKTKRLVVTASGARALLRLQANLPKEEEDNTLLVFDEITRGDYGMQIKHSTAIASLPLLLFSAEIAVAPVDNACDDNRDNKDEDEDKTDSEPKEKIMSGPDNLVIMVVDRWLSFKTTALEAAQICILRQRLAESIFLKVKHPLEELPARLGASMYAIASILSSGGAKGLSFQPVVPSVPNVSMVAAAVIETASIASETKHEDGQMELVSENNAAAEAELISGEEKPEDEQMKVESSKEKDLVHREIEKMEGLGSDQTVLEEENAPAEALSLAGNLKQEDEEMKESDIVSDSGKEKVSVGPKKIKKGTKSDQTIGNLVAEQANAPSEALLMAVEETKPESGNDCDSGNAKRKRKGSDSHQKEEDEQRKSEAGNMSDLGTEKDSIHLDKKRKTALMCVMASQ